MRGRSERKAKEALLSIWLEANVSKKEILQLYLDRAYMGGGTVGLSAAAQFYFGKQIKDLTLAEAAMLAGLFKRRPNTPSQQPAGGAPARTRCSQTWCRPAS
jgi:membrane peptidoglycan carboxypeptidase